MRQAGRFLPEYRKIREKHEVLEICKDAELCAKVTTMPVETLGVDAAIMFADIMLPLEGMGVRFRIEEGVGPVIKEPIANRHMAEALEELEPSSDVPFVLDAIKAAKKMLDGKTPLIGFCGAPFTIASYLIEGRPSRDFAKVKAVMYRDPQTWNVLMRKLAESMTKYLQAQIDAGVDAIQVFDSWVGCLSPQDYRAYALPYSQRILKSLERSGVPRIHFGTGTSNFLEEMKSAGGDVFSVDWRIPIDTAWRRLGDDVAVQGNLDPAAILADTELLKSFAADILRRVGGRRGHIFNLGHGMLPGAPAERVAELVRFIHETTQLSTSNQV
jgi:uroporphyrinogen decarboxylase